MVVDVQQPINDERCQLIAQVSEQIIEAHLTTCNYTSNKVREGLEKYECAARKGALVSTDYMTQSQGALVCTDYITQSELAQGNTIT